MTELPAHLLDSAIDMSSLASDDQLARARTVATEYAKLERDITDLEAQLKEKRTRYLELSMRELPSVLGELSIDKIGLPEMGVDVVVAPYYKANIAADWPEEKRDAAFTWLEENGHGDLIKSVLSVTFGRKELELARQLEELIRTQFAGANSHPVSIDMSVPWNTLTAFVREQIQRGESLPLDTLGATVGSVATVKKRKTSDV